MASYVTLPRLNALRFRDEPLPKSYAQRLCREGKLPAIKVGGEWRVDLDAFDRGQTERLDPVVEGALRRLGGATT